MKKDNEWLKIDAERLNYFQLNQLIREKVLEGHKKIEVHNVFGQRYIGTDLNKNVNIEIYGTPGN